MLLTTHINLFPGKLHAFFSSKGYYFVTGNLTLIYDKMDTLEAHYHLSD
jgi:hypothetical protein